MTISSEINKSGPYDGNGSATDFEFDFKISEPAHLLVLHTNGEGTETQLSGDAYQVTQDEDGTGHIILPSPLPTGEKITLLLNPPFTQLSDLPNQGAWNPKIVESALDKLTSCLLKLREEVSRSVKIKASNDLADLDDLLADIERLADASDGVKALAGVKAKLVECADNIASIQTATTSATNAANSASTALDAKTQAITAKDQSILAQTAAEAARDTALSATPITASNKGRELVGKTTEAEMRTVLGAASNSSVQVVIDALAEKATKVALNSLQNQVNNFSAGPVGSIIVWSFEVPPADYLELNGATLNRTDYPDLFAAVNSARMLQSQGSKQHTQWGNGDGSTTFSLPDWRGEHLIGWDHGRGIDTGRGMLTWQADAVKAHTHSGSSLSVFANNHGGTQNAGGGSYKAPSNPNAGYAWQGFRCSVSGSVGTTGAATNRVRTVAAMFLIKFR